MSPTPSAETVDAPASLAPSPPSAALRRLQRELMVSLAEARSLRELLEELPAILERKFQQRLEALLREQRQLALENERLQLHLVAVLSGDQSTLRHQALPTVPEPSEHPAEGHHPNHPKTEESPLLHGLGLRRALRRHLQR